MSSAATIFDFHGGIHPEQNKTQSLQLPLGKPKLPQELILPLGQHIGQASRPLVHVGDYVLKGQTIAINNGFLSSFLHAPTSGHIKAIEEKAIAHPSGLQDACIVLEPDNQETWCELHPLPLWQESTKTDVLTYLAEMGIVGMGGAGFPTQVKLQGAQKNNLEYLIINAAECEPYITADDMLIREKTAQLVQGIQILQFLAEANEVLIGIEDNKPKAIERLQNELRIRHLEKQIKLVVVPTKYPSGGEKQLIQLLTDQEVPSGKHPIDIGIICQNVGTCVAIYDAIVLGKPLISRITTLTGDALSQPQNVEVLLGTPIEHLLNYAGCDASQLQRLIMGGPMMGFTLENHAVPVVKTTNCILAGTAKELPQPAPEQACIRCGMCEQVCPASLLPQQLLWFTKSQEFEKAEHYNLFDCIECGACSYVCPSNIPLVQYYRHGKSEIREAREANIKSDHAKIRFEARKARQEAEAAEKEAKRLARTKPAPKKDHDKKVAAGTPEAAKPSTANDASKKLKIDIAIAKAKLKKLEKALTTAQEEERSESISQLQIEVDEQKNTLSQLETELSTVAPAPVKTAKVTNSEEAAIKQLKIDTAIAKAAVKKIEKAIKRAEDINAPELGELNQQLETATSRAAELDKSLTAAKDAFEKSSTEKNSITVERKGPSDTDQVASKKLKIDIAIANAAVKKAKKNIDAMKSDGLDESAIEASGLTKKLNENEAKVTALQAQLAQLTPSSTNTSSDTKAEAPNPLADQIKKQKIAVALAKAQLSKLNKKLEKEPENAAEIQIAISEKQAAQMVAETELSQLLNTQEKN
ncbi:electron transport complex subunit RsxC [Marinomonas sp. 15G1-11]|uniref:Ion-translocating oxidoreductase complex subunit C n=1 Tax=Marinomonas phaeophyticola TaxID=3004091 RepID=A0ABT4JRJ8_9GAMM|nr:electron transport complex subunit RsxC [Marinomonas sp. 15G1-11]MCZ2720647.1 electron transport complex subunit RsxC [Marinomonas sp. 15G1-11]